MSGLLYVVSVGGGGADAGKQAEAGQAERLAVGGGEDLPLGAGGAISDMFPS
jgi:hypothetical protein